jgi:hypothetical protein
MSRVLARLLPPLLADAGRAVRDRVRGRKRVPVWEHLPQGWDTQPAPPGWDVRGVVAAQEAAWPRFLELARGTAPLGIANEAPVPGREDVVAHNTVMAFGYVLALAARERDRLDLLDWGGGLGHYYVLARALLPGVGLDYTAYDLPLACEAGRRLLPGVRFVELPASGDPPSAVWRVRRGGTCTSRVCPSWSRPPPSSSRSGRLGTGRNTGAGA